MLLVVNANSKPALPIKCPLAFPFLSLQPLTSPPLPSSSLIYPSSKHNSVARAEQTDRIHGISRWGFFLSLRTFSYGAKNTIFLASARGDEVFCFRCFCLDLVSRGNHVSSLGGAR